MTFHCPTPPESIAQTVALLPRGRAWGADNGSPEPFIEGSREGSTIWRYFATVGTVRNYLETRLCALRLEFWCQTIAETREQWLREYGLPDPCDAYPDLCTKVAAIGGTRCENYAEVAARLGWTVDCVEGNVACGAQADCAQADCAQSANLPPPNRIEIIVDIEASPAFTGRYFTQPYADCMQADLPLACLPDIGPLQCVLERIVHAEIDIVYTLIPPATYLMVDADTHFADEAGDLLTAE